MSKRRTPPPQPTAKVAVEEAKKPLWRKPGVWLGGVATAVITGVLINLLVNAVTDEAQRTIGSTSVAIAARGKSKSSVSATGRASGKPHPSLTPSGPPLAVVSEDPLHLEQMNTWVFPARYLPSNSQLKYIDSVFQPQNPAAMTRFAQWFFARGAYEPGSVDTQLVVRNNRPYTINILDMNVMKSCQSPLRGTMFFGAGGAVEKSVGIGFNLDSSDTEAKTAHGTEPSQWKSDYFDTYTISIPSRAVRVFNIYAITNKLACSFYLRVTIADGSKQTHQDIYDGGIPFRVTALDMPADGGLFKDYEAGYIGGVGNPPNGAFVRVNPKTYR